MPKQLLQQWSKAFILVKECLYLSKILFGVFPDLRSAERVSPDNNQAVFTVCFDPVVHIEGISGQTGFSWLPGGISKPCKRFSHQLPLTDRSQSCS